MNALDAGLDRSDDRLQQHNHAALDFLQRIERAAGIVRDSIARGNVTRAARAASQLAALSRLAESRLHLALERRVAVLELADDLIAALPPAPPRPLRSVDRLRRMVDRDG